MRFAIVWLLLSITTFSSVSDAQSLFFTYEAGPNPVLPRYSWNPFLADQMVSPSGQISFGERVGYATFEEFAENVVGVWEFEDSGVKGTFEILPLSSDIFFDLQMISPLDGEQIFAGEVFDLVSVPDVGSDSTRLFCNDSGVVCNCDGDGGTIQLPEGLDSTVCRISEQQGGFRFDLFNNKTGPGIFGLLVSSIAPRVDVTVLRRQLGDVNGDGVVSLLDVAPFVQLLSSGKFQFEADIDGDGAVTLLDVGPFIDLLNE